MTPLSLRMTEVPSSEAPWPVEAGAQGHLMYVRCETPAVRPAVHILEHGRLIMRTPTQATALVCRPSLSCHADELKTAGGVGWTVTATGPAEIITDPRKTDHSRPVSGWAHAPHDTLVRICPQTVTGFRLAHAEAVR